MTRNIAMFERIADQIMADPSAHDQKEWELRTECGTTRCVAGWALHFWAIDEGLRGEGKDWLHLNDIAEKYAQKHMGLEYAYISEAAADLLGLSPFEAEWLFSAARTEDEAYDMVVTCAEGRT